MPSRADHGAAFAEAGSGPVAVPCHDDAAGSPADATPGRALHRGRWGLVRIWALERGEGAWSPAIRDALVP